VVTVEGDVWARIEAIRAGADDCLETPIDPALLIATVFTRIERARYVRSLVERDGLTGLLTHGSFMRLFRETWDKRQRHPDWQPTLILIDIDHFKQVNDTYGHPVGDRVLAALAALLRKGLRRSDLTARYGGEEFAIILQDLGVDDSVRLANRLREEFAALQHPSDSGTTFCVTFSGGVAAITPGMTSADEWRLATDQALYTAKREGRNRIVQA
jgi:diguanylate cyclase (GGDEF)-like protein